MQPAKFKSGARVHSIDSDVGRKVGIVRYLFRNPRWWVFVDWDDGTSWDCSETSVALLDE